MLRHVGQHMGSNPRNQDKSQFVPAKFVPCVYYNKNACFQNKTHETKGVYIGIFVQHVGQQIIRLMVIHRRNEGQLVKKNE